MTPRGAVQAPVKVVHALHRGHALCDVPGDYPADWPEGHYWVRIDDDPAMVTCEICQRRLTGRRQ